jgi:hypothetical protein
MKKLLQEASTVTGTSAGEGGQDDGRAQAEDLGDRYGGTEESEEQDGDGRRE